MNEFPLDDSFIEEDDPDMRLLSIRDASTKDTVGFIFWRNIPRKDMQHWLKDFDQSGHDHLIPTGQNLCSCFPTSFLL